MAAGESFSDEIWEDILIRIANGQPLREISRLEGYPSHQVVDRKRNAEPEFEDRFARARLDGFDAIAQETLEIADDASNDWMERTGKDDESIGWQLNGEHVQRSKLRIETRLKLLAKWDPKRYGDRVTQEHTGSNGGPIEMITRRVVDPASDGTDA